MAFYYSIYGMELCSNRAIPGLIPQPATGQIDLQLWFERLPESLHESQSDRRVLYQSSEVGPNNEPALIIYEYEVAGFYSLHYADGTKFVIDSEIKQIWATWPENATLEDTATYLLGPVMGIVLMLKRIVCLHASAVAIGNQAIALLGDSGAGKSTTAAAFARAGYKVLSDDVVTLVERDGDFLIQPAYPYIRLWPESVKIFYGREDALPLLTPNWDKCRFDLVNGEHLFQTQPLPLAAIYVLGERSDDPAAPFIESLPSGEGLINLIVNSYTTSQLSKEMRGEEFLLLGRVFSETTVRRVRPHKDPAHLPRLCQVIVEDFQASVRQPALSIAQGGS